MTVKVDKAVAAVRKDRSDHGARDSLRVSMRVTSKIVEAGMEVQGCRLSSSRHVGVNREGITEPHGIVRMAEP
jgi:hypothetical protein